MSDEAIRRRTGRGWEEWFDLLDAWGAAERPRAEALRWVADEHGIDGWNAQAVTRRRAARARREQVTDMKQVLEAASAPARRASA